jgi:hypothetical protein
VFKNPFIFKSVHLAHMALKDEQIALLRSELSNAREDRLRAETARDAAVAQAFTLLAPRPAEVGSPEVNKRTRQPEPPTLDLAEVDPTDNAALAQLALREMPAGKRNASLLQHKIASIRTQVYAAIAAKSERAKEVGTVAAPQDTPSWVSDMIDGAIAQGKEQARTN